MSIARRAGLWLAPPAAVVTGLLLLYGLARREAHDPYDRTIGPTRVDAVIEIAAQDTGVCRCSPDQTIAIDYAGFTTHGDLYGIDELRRDPRPTAPGVVLIHGNTARGRRLAPYRALATRLAARGAVVLAYDQLGFGTSDDPFGRGPEAARLAYDRTALAAAVSHRLIEHAPSTARRLTVVGHSGGALPALRLAFENPNVGSAVLIGPPRRVAQRSEDSDDVAYFAERFVATYRWVYGRELPSWLAPEHLAAEGPYSLEEHLHWPTAPGLGEAGHVPVLWVDGGREDEAELAYLDTFLGRVAKPSQSLRQPRANHYLNSAESLGFVVYDTAVVDELAAAILDLAKTTAGERQAARDQRRGNLSSRR